MQSMIVLDQYGQYEYLVPVLQAPQFSLMGERRYPGYIRYYRSGLCLYTGTRVSERSILGGAGLSIDRLI